MDRAEKAKKVSKIFGARCLFWVLQSTAKAIQRKIRNPSWSLNKTSKLSSQDPHKSPKYAFEFLYPQKQTLTSIAIHFGIFSSKSVPKDSSKSNISNKIYSRNPQIYPSVIRLFTTYQKLARRASKETNPKYLHIKQL